MKGLRDRRKAEKPFAKTCSICFKECFFGLGSLLTLKNEYNMTTPRENDHMWTEAKRQNRTKGQITSERKQCSVFLGAAWCYSLWASKTPVKMLIAHALNNSWPNETLLSSKTAKMSINTTQTDFPSWHCTGILKQGDSDSSTGCFLELGITGSYSLLTRRGTNWSPLICIDRAHNFWATVLFIREFEKMGRFLVQSKTGIFWDCIYKFSQRWEKCLPGHVIALENKFGNQLFKINVIFQKNLPVSYANTWYWSVSRHL